MFARPTVSIRQAFGDWAFGLLFRLRRFLFNHEWHAWTRIFARPTVSFGQACGDGPSAIFSHRCHRCVWVTAKGGFFSGSAFVDISVIRGSFLFLPPSAAFFSH